MDSAPWFNSFFQRIFPINPLLGLGEIGEPGELIRKFVRILYPKELNRKAAVAKFATVQKEGIRAVSRKFNILIFLLQTI